MQILALQVYSDSVFLPRSHGMPVLLVQGLGLELWVAKSLSMAGKEEYGLSKR